MNNSDNDDYYTIIISVLITYIVYVLLDEIFV